MARIVLGMATSHGPMLSTPPEEWGQRVVADRRNEAHWFRGETYGFDDLATLRRSEGLDAEITGEVWRARHAACRTALDALHRIYAEAAPDVAVLLGNDQREVFGDDNYPAFLVYRGETIENPPATEEQRAMMPPGVAIAERGHRPPQAATYPGLPELGEHLIESLIDAEFDVAQARVLPSSGNPWNSGIPHAFGFLYRQIMRDAVIPNVPVFLNTFYPPNQPTASRCHRFGQALGRAIESWPSDLTVAVFASGGLSHFVIDEELDRTVLDALQTGDADALIAIPENRYQSGSSEIKNWIPLAAIMADCGLDMTLVDYVPCYRSEAGTGNAMAFAHWG